MNEKTFGKLAKYSINNTLGILEASTFDLECNFASHTPLNFLNFSNLASSCAFSLVTTSVGRLSGLKIVVVWNGL